MMITAAKNRVLLFVNESTLCVEHLSYTSYDHYHLSNYFDVFPAEGMLSKEHYFLPTQKLLTDRI
jgi:hypothetical protein